MRVGITGWRGFIGSYLLRCIEAPVLFGGDLRDLSAVKAFVNKCDRIYHVAGLNRAKEGAILTNNLHATGNLVLSLKLLKANAELVFLSSKQVEWNPDSEYGFAKSVEEDIVRRAGKWCIFRVPNVYGPMARPFYNSVVATFAYQLAHGGETVVDNPAETREFIFVEDLVEQVMMPRLYQCINIWGEVMSIGDVYEYLTTRLGEHKNLAKCLDYYRRASVPSS